MSTRLIMIHNKPVTFLVYGILGGWFVAGLLAADAIWLDWYARLVRERKLLGFILSIPGAIVTGVFGFLPYAIRNTMQYGVHIFAERRRENDLAGMKKDAQVSGRWDLMQRSG